jgi:hypothetical protein
MRQEMAAAPQYDQEVYSYGIGNAFPAPRVNSVCRLSARQHRIRLPGDQTPSYSLEAIS